MKINKYGVKMTGLKLAAGATKPLSPYAPWHIQIGYDMATGKVICSEVYSDCNYLVYHDDTIITLPNITRPMTM